MSRVLLLDIEGTTSSISFVKEVLFPYAAEHLAAWVHARRREPRVMAVLDAARTVVRKPLLSDDEVVTRLLRWIAEDAKITPLKTLQGWIWKDGFESGAFVGHMYPDAVERMQAWHAAGDALYIYSSGSVGAQRLYFRHTEAGDLTPLLSGHFDTSTGSKREADSYRTIAAAIGDDRPIVFLSDVLGELNAAREAGLATVQLARDGQSTADHPVATDFHEAERHFP